MKPKLYILIPVFCLLGVTSKAQVYFNKLYDTFGSCDGTNYIDTFANQYVTANFTCSSVSFYALNLKLYDIITGIVSNTKTYDHVSSNYAIGKGIKTNNNHLLLAGSRFYRNDTSLVYQWIFNNVLDSVRFTEYGYLNQGNVINDLVYDNGKYYYMVGQVYDSNYNSDILLIKTDTSGTEIWKKKIGIPGTDETALSINTLNGKLIVAGYFTTHNANSYNGFVMYLDTSGNTIWNRNTNTNNGGGSQVKTLSDGTILVYSPSKAYVQAGNIYSKLKVEKITAANTTIWTKTIGPAALSSGPSSAIEDENHHIIICGQAALPDNTVSGVVYKLNQNGDSLLYKQYRILPNSQNYFRDVVQSPDKGYCFAGFVTPLLPDTGTEDIWLLKVDSNFCESAAGCLTTGVNELNTNDNTFSMYPNPANNELYFVFDVKEAENISIELMDIQGRLLVSKTISNSGEPYKLDIENLSEGVYLYRVTAGKDYFKTGKVVIIK